MSKFKNWNDVKKELNFTPEEEAEMMLEKELIKAIIEARKKANLTQRDLSEKSGVIQPSIAKIESFARSPQATTLIKLLYPNISYNQYQGRFCLSLIYQIKNLHQYYFLLFGYIIL